jgi:hypothetical protein
LENFRQGDEGRRARGSTESVVSNEVRRYSSSISPSMASDERRQPPPDPTRPLDDPAEAVERIVPRRQLLLEDGDVLIMREAGGFREGSRVVYQLRIRGRGPLADQRFASFEHAAARGEELATERKVRLFYFESAQEPPHLLKDARAR